MSKPKDTAMAQAAPEASSTALIPALDDPLIDVLRASLYPGAERQSVALALAYCKSAGLDPIQKPVHIVPMWDRNSGKMRDVILPGIGLYRTAAARSGQYAGISEPEFGPTITREIGGREVSYPEWCKITVKRRLSDGTIAEFTAREFWMENYAKKGGKEKSIAPNDMWERRAFAQIAKCSEAQALRKAFPELCGAQPTAEELEGKSMREMGAVEIVAEPSPPPLPDNMPEHEEAALAAANNGRKAFETFWKGCDLAVRNALRPDIDHFKKLFEAADQARAEAEARQADMTEAGK